MTVLKIKIKEKEILKVEVEDNYKPYAFVLALYVILVISAYSTRMYQTTMNNEIRDLTTLLVIIYTTIYLAKK